MTSCPHKRWRILETSAPLPGGVPDSDIEAACEALRLSPSVGRILARRGITGETALRAFLRPSLNDLRDPALIPGLDLAAARVCRAVANRENIVIYGDYDVDGVTAVAILLRCLALMGVQADYYIPDRMDEGYGLNESAIRGLAATGARLLVTVDCGISSVREAALARSLGVDLIVTDHHEPGDEVPDACVINPKLPGCLYPFRELSGAGLAFKLAWAIGQNLSAGRRVSPEFREFLLDAVALAGLGTIADVVPLRDENRVLASFGLQGLGRSDTPGLRALREAAGVAQGPLTSHDVAFKLAPRLNAAGRMGSARKGVELLTTHSRDRAEAIAAELNQENARRQRLQEEILAEAQAMIAGHGTPASAIVLAREGWHAGVLGIVAARLAAAHWRPAVLLTLEGDEGHGSARSIAPFNLFLALQECAGKLRTFGGHAMAAGLRLDRNRVEEFRAEFERVAAARLSEADLAPVLDLDAEVRLEQVSDALARDIAALEPFGAANHEPILAAFDLAVPGAVERVGADGRHLSFWVRQNGVALRTIGFGLGPLAPFVEERRVCSLAFTPRLRRFQGIERLEMHVRDIQVGPRAECDIERIGSRVP